jgi:hypothetical protein
MVSPQRKTVLFWIVIFLESPYPKGKKTTGPFYQTGLREQKRSLQATKNHPGIAKLLFEFTDFLGDAISNQGRVVPIVLFQLACSRNADLESEILSTS